LRFRKTLGDSMSRNAFHTHVARNSRVLVVEDEWLIADEVCHQLLKAGYRVVGPVPSVHEALSFIGEDEVDAALLDYRLNDKDSCQIAEELAAHDIPFAFLTGYDPRESPTAVNIPVCKSRSPQRCC
jgi:CheY-like chemotaxis protein